MGGGNVNPLEVVGNVATGGLLGAGESLAQGRPGSALENLGPWGAAVHPINPQIADMGNAIGAGAGVAGGLASGGTGAFTPGGFGAATPGATVDPAYFGFDEATLQSLGTTPYSQFSTGVPTQGLVGGPAAGVLASGISGGTGAGAGAGGGGGGTSALLGASLAQQLAGMLGGASPFAATPQGGAVGPGGPGALTPQQLAALSAMQDEAHRGLAPGFEQRMSGKPQTPGMAGANFTA